MKLSEILGWDKPRELIFKDGETFANIARNEANTALTSCDLEIDREALAFEFYKRSSNNNRILFTDESWLNHREYYLKEADWLISTMPTWLKRIEK